MSEFGERYGPWAVVTGAAAGVGFAFAQEILERDVGVVLVDISPDVGAVADELDGPTRAVVADLRDPVWIDGVAGSIEDLEIGLAVANAGLSFVGNYLDMDRSSRHDMVAVNCRAVDDLAAWALPPMVERGRGGFVAMSSGSALAGTAGVALYSATKAYAVNLVEAVGWELRESGVDLLAVVAPSMDTPGFRSHDADPSRRLGPPVDPRTVVAGALDALSEGGRWLGDPGLEVAAGLDRRQRVDLMGSATTAMYPHLFP